MDLQQDQRHAKCIHLSFQDFLFDASEELGNFVLPGGEQVHAAVSGVIKTLPIGHKFLFPSVIFAPPSLP
jgi:hypothetical protein